MGKRSRRHAVSKGSLALPKRQAKWQQQARQLGGERIGILAIDVAKFRICATLRNCYGEVLLPPATDEQTRSGLGRLIAAVRTVVKDQGLGLVIVGLEQTGRFHETVLRALPASWQVLLIHPLLTAHLRAGDSPSGKTDGRDLDAIFQAVLTGAGRAPPAADGWYSLWQAEFRGRNQLVDERSRLKEQMHERLQAVLPGLSGCFDDVWAAPLVPWLLQAYASPAAVAQCTVPQLAQAARQAGLRRVAGQLPKVLAWAQDAPAPAPTAPVEREWLLEDFADLAARHQRGARHEWQLLGFLVETPDVLLLSLRDLNHVAVGAFGAAAGPLTNDLTPRALSGRAGLYQRRYQSDTTDHDTRTMAHGEPYLRAARRQPPSGTVGRAPLRQPGAPPAAGNALGKARGSPPINQSGSPSGHSLRRPSGERPVSASKANSGSWSNAPPGRQSGCLFLASVLVPP